MLKTCSRVMETNSVACIFCYRKACIASSLFCFMIDIFFHCAADPEGKEIEQ